MDEKLILLSHFFDTTLLKKNCKIKCNETTRVEEKSVFKSKFVIWNGFELNLVAQSIT